MPVNFDDYKELEPIPENRDDLDRRRVSYGLSKYKESDGEVFYETRDVRIPPEDPADYLHTVTTGEAICRFDVLSVKWYNTVRLWWILPDTNGIIDLFDWDGAQKILRIPAITSVFREVIRK